MPDRSPDSLSPAEELFADWLARREGGAGAEDLEAFCHDHPKEAAELRRLWVTWQGLRGVLEKAGFSSGPRSLTRRIQEEFGSGVDPNISLDAGEGNVPPSDALLKRLAEHTLKTSRYQLRGEIARGGMGAILKVWDEDLRRALAMKVILGKAEEVGTGGTPPVNRRLLARFVEEAQVTGQLDHPGIVPVHELGLDSDGHVFFTMKLVKGRDLKAIFEQVFAGNTDWTEARAIGVILKVCEAMAYAHAKGVVHRDLKPDNVMVGSFGEVYVMDWGLARVLGRKDTHDIRLQSASAPHSSIQTERREEREGTPDSPLVTMDGDVVGTPAYMPPEQARGEIERLGPQSDVYSIGAMLYHLLTRHMPYVPAGARASNRAVLGMVLHGPPPEVRRNRVDVPGELAAICEKAMAREPALRYRDTLELASDLRAYLEGRVVRAYEAGAWAEARKWVARNKGLAASVAAAGIALVYGAVAHEQAQGKRAAEEQRVIAEEQRMRAQENEALARTEKARADANALKAEGLAKTARYQSYVANIRSADAALELNEGRNARRFLDEAPEEHRNWEWRYLDAQTDGSLLVLRHGGSVRTAEFSPDGKNVLTASDDGSNRLWGADDGRELLVMSGHTGRFARYSPDGKRIVTSSGDELAAVWDVARREEMAVLRGHSDDITLARFSPDGSRIATGSNDGTVRVWDAAKGSELVVLRGHESWIWDIDFGPDGRRLATGSHDATVRVWDLETGKQRVLLRGGESPNSLSTCASFSTNDRWVVAAFDDYTVRVWDVGSVGSLYTKVEVAVLEGHKGWIRSVSFPRFGNMVATASDDGTARLWDPGRTEVTVLRGHTGDVFLARFNRDGSGLLTVSSDETARVWDVAGGTQASVLRGHEGPVLDGAFSPDDLRVVTASDDGTARVWDASGNAEARTLRGHEGHHVVRRRDRPIMGHGHGDGALRAPGSSRHRDFRSL
jgi:WD40 repeat protein